MFAIVQKDGMDFFVIQVSANMIFDSAKARIPKTMWSLIDISTADDYEQTISSILPHLIHIFWNSVTTGDFSIKEKVNRGFKAEIWVLLLFCQRYRALQLDF